MRQQLLPALRLKLFFTILLGVVYPLAVTAICQFAFSDQANGSLVTSKGAVVGSKWIGQSFTRPEYFHSRPSAAGTEGYDAAASGGSNYGPTNQKLADRVRLAVEKFRKENPDYTGPIPADLLTTSASGLDPHLSPDSALAQASRVAKARGAPPDAIAREITRFTERPDLGFLGEPRVNVLLLNLALDQNYPVRKTAGMR